MKNLGEIGSEFWIEQSPIELDDIEYGYVLSGRTAIDIILKDIEKKQHIGSVYMPAYCCGSMLAPFVAHGYNVELYDIAFTNSIQYDIDRSKQVDILYVTNYFGYNNTLQLDILKWYKDRGAIIIYDRTHSLFREEKQILEIADYTFASIRKWMGVVTGAVVLKRTGFMDMDLKSCLYWKDKANAMYDKYRYLNGDKEVEKQQFLDRFGVFGHHLEEDYVNYAMDSYSYQKWLKCNKEMIKQNRNKNAAFIHSALDGIKAFQFLSNFDTKAVPLFVPIIFNSEEHRNMIRKKLIESQIYCPIHWPKNKMVQKSMKVNDIFSREISLICDQRYSPHELMRMVDVIIKNV